MSQTDERALILAARNMASAASSSAQVAINDADAAKALAASVDNSMKAAAIVFEKYLSITRTSILTVLPPPQVFTFMIAEAKVGDLISIHRAGKPTNGSGANPPVVVGGISLESTGFVPEAGKVEVYYSIPTIIVALGATLTIPVRIRGFRAS